MRNVNTFVFGWMSETDTCYSLTMRNVNDFEKLDDQDTPYSYSLTMRNVNIVSGQGYEESYATLFINYEECKSRYIRKIRKRRS